MNLSQISNYLGFTKPQPAPVAVVTPAFQEPQGPKEVLFSWDTLSRPHNKILSPKMLRTLIVIGIVVCLILALMQEFILIIAIASIGFISYALSKTPPEAVKHEVTTHGISFAGTHYNWSALKNFFFSTSNGNVALVVSTKDSLPGRLFFSFPLQEKDKLKEIFSRYLAYLEQEPLTVLDKAYNSAIDKLNLDR